MVYIYIVVHRVVLAWFSFKLLKDRLGFNITNQQELEAYITYLIREAVLL